MKSQLPCPHCGKYPIKHSNLSDLVDLLHKVDDNEPDFPGQNDEYKRHLLVKWAIHHLEDVIFDIDSNNSEEELDLITSSIAKAFADKVHLSLQNKLLKKVFMNSHKEDVLRA